MFTQEKKTALVTGASSGMGKAIARRLIQDGYQVYVAARHVEKMADLASLGAQPLRMDISLDAEIVSGVETILAQTGGVDVLVNNAGFGLYGPVEEIDIEEARYQFEVNLFGAARLTQLLLPGMRARRSGHIVNITSMGGKMYSILGAWYHATKHALEGWSDCLRLEVAEFGIKVVIVEPGVIETGFGDAASDTIVRRSASGPYGHLVKMVAMSIKKRTGRGQAALRRSLRKWCHVRFITVNRERGMRPVNLQKCSFACASGWAIVYSTVLFSVKPADRPLAW